MSVLSCFVMEAMSYTRMVSFSGEPALWSQKNIPYWIHAAGSSQIANGSEFAAAHAAFRTWQNVATADVSFQYMGTTPIRTVGQDGINLVTFADDTILMGSEVVAATFLYFQKDSVGTVIEEADIALNPSVLWSASAEPDRWDMQGVITHNVGHFIGLGESPLLSSVMMPYGAPAQLLQRVLKYDDIAGVTESYPEAAAISALGAISGRILRESLPVFGAHVVALDENGTPVLSGISSSDGSYRLSLLPAGSYRLYAEPLDDPVSEQNIGGAPGSYYYHLNTSFGTTFLGDGFDINQAPAVKLNPGQTVDGKDIRTAPATTLNVTEPGGTPARFLPGQQTWLTIGGADFTNDAIFAASSPGISLALGKIGGSIGPYAPMSADLRVTVSPSVAPGPKSLIAWGNYGISILSGGLVVTLPPPSNIKVSTAAGPAAGGTAVTITGQDFRSGVQVFFGGLPAASVQFVNSNTIQANAPAGNPGSVNLVVVNADGTWGVLANAFTYQSQALRVLSLSATSGPPTTVLTIQGEGFDAQMRNLQVFFGSASARILSASTSRIEAIVPYGASSGPVRVVVSGQSAAGPNFTVVPLGSSSNHAPDIPQFIDATIGAMVPMNNINDAVSLVELPFTFSLFRDIYPAGSKIAICTNGWISLDAITSPESRNGPLPGKTVQRPDGSTGLIPTGLIAPFFSDLYVRTGLFVEVGRKITTRTVGTAPNRQFVIEWSDMGILDENQKDTGARVTFEVVLYEGSQDIQFIYSTLSGLLSDGSTATIGIQDSSALQAIQSGFNQNVLSGVFSLTYHFENGSYTTTSSVTARPFSFPDQGGFAFSAASSGNDAVPGYAFISPNSGKDTPTGTAVIGFSSPDGSLLSEVSVPASTLVTGGRVYFEANDRIRSGIALANPNNQIALVSFYFTDSAGNNYGWGNLQIPANGQIAGFLDETPFTGIRNSQGTMTFAAKVSISAIGLRGVTNERGEFLMTSLPITPLAANSTDTEVLLPRAANGGGWSTDVLLVNPTDAAITGKISFTASEGGAWNVTANGETGSSFSYALAQRSSYRLAVSSSQGSRQSGWVTVTRDTDNTLPAAVAVVSSSKNGVTTNQTAVSSATGTIFRSLVEAQGAAGTAGSVRSGLVLMNSSTEASEIYCELRDFDGNYLGLYAGFTLSAASQREVYLTELFPALTLPFQGVLRVTSSGSIKVAGIREKVNQRRDALYASMAVSEETTAASAEPRFFPHLVHGGGYSVQFTLFSGITEQATNGNLLFYNQKGSPLPLPVK